MKRGGLHGGRPPDHLLKEILHFVPFIITHTIIILSTVFNAILIFATNRARGQVDMLVFLADMQVDRSIIVKRMMLGFLVHIGHDIVITISTLCTADDSVIMGRKMIVLYRIPAFLVHLR